MPPTSSPDISEAAFEQKVDALLDHGYIATEDPADVSMLVNVVRMQSDSQPTVRFTN